MSWLRRLLGLCEHEWILHDTIHEQNLRYGYDHWSEIHVCTKCGKHRTIELPRSTG